MTARAPGRWVLSFADLCLVLVACFVMLHATAGRSGEVAASMRESFGGEGASEAGRVELVAARLFEPGEAVLKPAGRTRLLALGRRAGGGTGPIALVSRGTDAGSARLDSFELAAARTGAIARALREGGVAEGRIAPTVEPGAGAQRVTLTF